MSKAQVIGILLIAILVLGACAPAPTPTLPTAPTPAPMSPSLTTPAPAPTPASPTAPTQTPTPASTPTLTPTPMPRGTKDADIIVDIYRADKAWPGTTLMRDVHNQENPRVIEVNMLGEIIWQYLVPTHLRQYTNPGLDAELLPNNNILILLPKNGVYEVNRQGEVVWSYLDQKISHDADRLPNGNTLVAWGEDEMDDAQVKEINPKGEIVWAWYAKGHFNRVPYKDIYDGGWTHTNAVTRLTNGNTLISPRNFNFIVEVDPSGSVVRTVGEGILREQHDPEILPNGNIVVSTHGIPQSAVEIDVRTGQVVWEYKMLARQTWPLRDANRLPNGNTLITGSSKIVEVTPAGEIVWQLSLRPEFVQTAFAQQFAPAGLGFYKAERADILR